MKYKLSFLLLVLTLTACSNAERISSDTIIAQQAKDQLNQSDNSKESEEKSTFSLETDKRENIQKSKSDLQKLIDVKRGDEPKDEVPASRFIDMDYLVLVREEMGPFSELQLPWYKYALIGSSYDTYEKGITTDPNDTLYYKRDVDSQGNKCIGIYSIFDNELIFQSEAITYWVQAKGN